MLRVTPNIEIPDTEFEFTFARSGGPGGQNVNKVNSKAVLRWTVTETEHLPTTVKQRFLNRFQNRITRDGQIVIHSQKYRDQGRNVADCLERLREMIAVVARPPVKRRPTKPTKGSQRRRLDKKRQTAEKKQARRKPRLND